MIRADEIARFYPHTSCTGTCIDRGMILVDVVVVFEKVHGFFGILEIQAACYIYFHPKETIEHMPGYILGTGITIVLFVLPKYG